MRGRDFLLPLSPELGYWLAGFIDGEGCFSIARGSKQGWVCSFIVKLRADDRSLLESVRDDVGLGKITTGAHSTAGINGKPWVRWTICRKSELARLTEILDVFPLRSKKARDYAIWRDAAIYWSISGAPVDWSPIEAAFHELKAIREYAAAGGA